jgi:hypothetical protein
MQQQRMLDPLAMRSGEVHSTFPKGRVVGSPLTWAFIAIAGASAFAVAFINTSTQTQRLAASVTMPERVNQQAAGVTAAKPANIDAAPSIVEPKKQPPPKEVDFSLRLKEPAKHPAIQLQAGNSQIFYVYGAGIIKDTWGSLSERSNPVPVKRAIAGDVATLGTEVRNGKLWLTGYQQGSSRLIVLDDSGHELYDGIVYVY